jgi:predicted nucleotidyltransferase
VDLSDACVDAIRAWALRTNAVREVWLFGSRAKGTSRPGSDVDLALVIMPSAWGTYVALEKQWECELASIIGLSVHLQPIIPNAQGEIEPTIQGDREVLNTGKKLWTRTRSP